ncbi:MAG TPA: EAL domain-containing protein [Candidatus Limnocylindria bacterium]
MDQAAPSETAAAASATDQHVPVRARMALALGASALAGIVVERLLATAVDSLAVRVLLSALTAAILVGLALHRMVVMPLTRSHGELHQAYQAALADALADPLTRLGNHRAFQEELDRQVESSHRYGVPLALVLIDLDAFKAINDQHGHASGDRTLAWFGGLMATGIRRADRAFRVGGDEFAILLPHTDANGAQVVTRRLLASALQPALHADDPMSVSFSAGISAVPALATSRAQLYSQADSALYAAKRSGRTEITIFDLATEPGASVGGSGAAVAEVIARGQLRPVFQPLVHLPTRAVMGVEGLIRPVAPAPFADPAALFAAASASGHLVALDLACLEAIVAGAAALPPEQFLSVNLFPTTVEAHEFSSATILGILARHDFPPERLVLELTEQQPLTDPEGVRFKLETCRRAGIRLAADDVGAGNAGLRLLSELRFDMVKVDLSLVRRSASGSPSSAVIESVVSFAARTGATVVGEGIEGPEEIDQLTALGVLVGQGFLLGRPGSLPEPTYLAIPPPPPREVAPVAAAPLDSNGIASWRASIGLPAA